MGREERTPEGCKPPGPVRMLAFLVEISIHLQDSTGPVHIEVVMDWETEGRFLEDRGALRNETMRHVSKLGGFQ